MSNFHEKQKKMREQMAKRSICEAAIHVVSEKGYEHLTMHDVAEQAGIATGTIYNYFKNKEDLFSYVHEHVHQALDEQLDNMAQERREPRELIEFTFDKIFTLCDKYKTVFTIAKQLGLKERMPTEKKKAHISHHINVIANIIKEGTKLDKFRKVDSLQTGEIFLFSLVGLMEMENHLGEDFFQHGSQSIKSFFLNYLLCKED